MGCAGSRKENKISFEENERQWIKRLFDRLRSRYPKTANTDHICQESFEYLFEGRAELGAKLFRFMSKHSQHKDGKLDFDNFLQIAEILVKEPSALHLQGYRTLDKTEILNLISLQRIDIDVENFKDQRISYLEALTFLQDVEYICVESGLTLTWRPERDESVARSILSAVYPTSSGSVTWWSLMLFLKQLLPHLSEQIKTFFGFLFLTSNPPKALSRFVKPSYLITNNQFIYLALGNVYLQSANSVGLLWGSAHFGWNFKSLFDALMNFDGPTFFLFRFEDKNVSNPDDPKYRSSIIGGFNRKKWLDMGTYQGNEECYLFQLTPKFKIFPSQRFKRMFANESDLNTQNYCYLHHFDEDIGEGEQGKQLLNEVAPSGLGFGGLLRKQFRLWIDYEDMQNNSYVTAEDETYKNGSLVDPDLVNLKLAYMEVWGIGKETEVLSTQLLVEKANHLETQYLRQSMKVHKEVIEIMKSNMPPPPEARLSTSSPEVPQDLRQSRKERIMDLVPQEEAPRSYVPTQSRISRSQGQKSIKPIPQEDEQLQGELEELGRNTDQILRKYQKKGTN